MNNKLKVDLNDVIECIEFEGELLQHYYNKKTGIIIYIEDSSTATYKADDIHNLDSFEEWEKELILSINDFRENPSDYIQLPSHEDINEYGIMIEFCNNIEESELKNKILNNKDSFRELRQSIENEGLINDWYDYREGAERNLAIKWCNDNNIEY